MKKRDLRWQKMYMMPENPELTWPTGVYADLTTRNLVLQERGLNEGYDPEERRFEIAPSVLDRRIAKDFPEHEIPPDFKFSKEYYEKIKDEKERMRTYKSLEVLSQILDGVDAEIEENPWKFLHIPEDADAGYVRAARIRLSQLWHPDTMDPRNPEKLESVFKFSPFDFPLKGFTYVDWLQELRDFEPKTLDEAMEQAQWLGSQVSAETLASMDPSDKERYMTLHQKRQELEEKVQIIRQVMVIKAIEKMTTINKAVQIANKKLGVKQSTFAGYDWQETVQLPWTSPVNDELDQWVRKLATQVYSDLPLEGNGVVRKEEGNPRLGRPLEVEMQQPALTFYFGDTYFMEPGYRQSLDLRAFFAWMEIRMDNELAPSLLDGVVEMYSLNHHQRERFRLMLMNGESPDFIMKVLEIKGDYGTIPLKRFVWVVEEGPHYFHHHGPTRTTTSYSLGVEFTAEGELVLKYVHQAEQSLGLDPDWDEEARFTASDVELMRAIAYGPLLAG